MAYKWYILQIGGLHAIDQCRFLLFVAEKSLEQKAAIVFFFAILDVNVDGVRRQKERRRTRVLGGFLGRCLSCDSRICAQPKRL